MVAEHARVGLEHCLLKERGVQEIGVPLTREVTPAWVLIEASGGDAVPHLAHARKAGGERPRVCREHFLGGRLVERAVDPHGAEQRIARVLLEPPGRLGAAVGAMVDVPGPAVVGPGGSAELDARGDAAAECDQPGGWRRERVDVVEQPWVIAAGHGKSQYTNKLSIQ